jgi:hypothetical protein
MILTASSVRPLPVNSRRVMCPKEELYEFTVPDRTFFPGDLDSLGMPGCSGTYLSVGWREINADGPRE